MSVETLPLRLGPDANGMLITPDEFDAAEGEAGWRYELIRGVLIVTPAPLEEDRDPNEELGFLLRSYREQHPAGKALDKTLHEHDIRVARDRRRADRVIWAGLGRLPRRGEVPTIAVEFVSSGRRNRERDYKEKRDEYLNVGIQEYWIIDRFRRVMTVHCKRNDTCDSKVVQEQEVYATPLLPGFELPLARLFALADAWEE
ncbi:MAG: Uma2 family endonuclease [Planctomycetota bacterium]|nr:Uma2 family endonuclease [Planctomycetota bacterium]